MSDHENSSDYRPEYGRGVVARRPGAWVAAIFNLEDMYTGIPGWMPQELVTRQGADGEQPEPVTWNGWDCPYFEKAGADLIVRQHNEYVQQLAQLSGRVFPDDLLARFDDATASYHFYIVSGYDEDSGSYIGEWETYSGTTIDVEPGHSLELYPIGARNWIWERADT